MLVDSLKFARGAVKTSRISAELEHYRIKDGRVTGYNGHMALSAPVDIDFEAYPKAAMFSKAVEACETAVSMHMTAGGKLAVKSGKFKAYVPCLDEVSFPNEPAGTSFETPKNFVEDLAQISVFVAEDASRPWAMGVLVADGLYMATNNVVVVQKWSGHGLPRLNLPRFAVQELTRVGENPKYIQTDGSTITFVYSNGRWIKTSLYDDRWPFEMLGKIFSAEHSPQPLQEGFVAAVEKLRPFTESKSDPVYFEDGAISTGQQQETGVSIEVEGIEAGPIFSIHQLSTISQVADRIDWSLYPRPCLFYGDGLRGAIVGRNY